MSVPTFVFSSAIDQNSVSTFLNHIKALSNTECDEIHLFINSSGGSVPLAFGLVHLLQSLPCKVATYNMAEISSAALLLFAVGEERIALPRSRFFAHEVSKEGVREHTLRSLRRELEEIELDTANIAAFLSERTGLTQGNWKARMEAGQVISPAQAVSIGLATSIGGLPRFASNETFRLIAEL